MRNKILILSIVATICAASAVFAQMIQSSSVSVPPTSSRAQKYSCPMHPEVVTDYPGKCPKCGMTLVPLKPKRKPPTSNEADMHHHDHDMMNHEAHGAVASHGMEQQDMHMSMRSSVNIADPMSRESSGTAWVPDSTPMYGKMFMFGNDMLMLHGAIFPRTYILVTRANQRSGRPHSCTGFRQWIIRTRRSVITGRIQRTSRSASPRPVCNGAA